MAYEGTYQETRRCIPLWPFGDNAILEQEQTLEGSKHIDKDAVDLHVDRILGS